MKIWRKSRLSECHANLFANGRVRAIYVNIFVMWRAIYVNIFVMCAAMLSLASCNSDDNVERRLTTNQKEMFAQNISGEAYTIEQRVNDVWTIQPIKPRKDGAVYAFNDIGYELAPHSTRLFTIHVDSDKYDFERGQIYRIVKEFFKKGKKEPQSVYCYFSFE